MTDTNTLPVEPGMPREPEGRVLSTLNRDGSRRWLRPRVSPGRFLTGRRVVAYLLMVVFAVTPYVRIRGKPLLLLDLPSREFTVFGLTLFATDTLLLASLLLTIFLGIFLVTALFGRVWCGWGCPQTVYLEFLYRPIERLFEGRHYRTNGRSPIHAARMAGKYVVFFLLSVGLAHTFLAYFVPYPELFRWVRQSPVEHPAAFLIVAATTLLMMFDFSYFREHVCILMCPYGRLQSALLDRQSLIVSYDPRRGEPRGKRRRNDPEEAHLGDCIDCNLCVDTCPTGIDIRDGLQMECVGCAQCIDACDGVMTKVGKPRGLIRYSSQEAIERGKVRLLRPRVVIYPLLLSIAVGLFGLTLAGRGSADVSFLRNRNTTYTVQDNGEVANVLQVKVANRNDDPRSYDIAVTDALRVVSSDLPLRVRPREAAAATLHVYVPADRFRDGLASITIRVSDGVDFDREYSREVLGPLFSGRPAAEKGTP